MIHNIAQVIMLHRNGKIVVLSHLRYRHSE